MAPLKIVIVGGGIGGPSAALGLAQNGHNVTLIEQAIAGTEVGFAFRITPNSDRCLKHLGIDASAGGAVSANVVRRFDAKGKSLGDIVESDTVSTSKDGAFVFAYRPQLRQQLMKATQEAGVKVRSGTKVISANTEKTSVQLQDGTTLDADLIIGADGVHSAVKQSIVDVSAHPLLPSSGHNAFRFMVSREAASKDSILSSMIDDNARMLIWSGNDKAILGYPVDFNRQFNIVTNYPQALSDDKDLHETDDAAVAYNKKVSREKALEIFSDFDPLALRLFHLADPESFRVWKLVDSEDLPHWSSNCSTLLGDACHPVLPFSFSGASMAIEDAVTLAALLPSGTLSKDIPARLKLYEQIRKPRVARVRDSGRHIAQKMRDSTFLLAYRQFLASHDAVEVATQALKSAS